MVLVQNAAGDGSISELPKVDSLHVAGEGVGPGHPLTRGDHEAELRAGDGLVYLQARGVGQRDFPLRDRKTSRHLELMLRRLGEDLGQDFGPFRRAEVEGVLTVGVRGGELPRADESGEVGVLGLMAFHLAGFPFGSHDRIYRELIRPCYPDPFSLLRLDVDREILLAHVLVDLRATETGELGPPAPKKQLCRPPARSSTACNTSRMLSFPIIFRSLSEPS